MTGKELHETVAQMGFAQTLEDGERYFYRAVNLSLSRICRLFPLGRYYENGSYKYFLQVNECSNKSRAKIKVAKWLDTPNIKDYEKYINDWHYFTLDVQKRLVELKDSAAIKDINMYILKKLSNPHVKPMDTI